MNVLVASNETYDHTYSILMMNGTGIELRPPSTHSRKPEAPMRFVSMFLGLLSLFLLESQAYAGQGKCLRDIRLGQYVCAPQNGGISQDRNGQIVCAPGQCVRDPYGGKVYCSPRPGGFAKWDGTSFKFACTDGCIEASSSYCQVSR